MGGSSKSQVVGYRYYFGIHMGIGVGPVDALHEITVGGKTAWVGEVKTNTTINIDQYNLFGGEAKEGGVQGYVEVMFGESSQVAPGGLTAMLGSPISGFRKMFTAFYNGLVSMNNPYPKPWKFRFNRTLKGWGGAVFQPGLAVIDLADVVSTYVATIFNYPLKAPGGENTGQGSLSALALPASAFYYVNQALELSNVHEGDPSNIAANADLIFSEPLTNFDKLEFAIDLIDHTITLNAPEVGLNVGLFRVANVEVNFASSGGGGGGSGAVFLLQYGRYFGLNQFLIYYYDTSGFVGTIPVGNPASIRFRAVCNNESGRTEIYLNNVLWLSQIYPAGATAASSLRLLECGGPDYAAVNFYDDRYRIRIANLRAFGTKTDSIRAMNPAHIIYQALTDKDWGRGIAEEKLDATSFTAVASQLVAEGFGLCLKWTRKDSINSFIRVVIDHIGGALYQSRETGLMTLKLIRADYDIDAMTVLTTENGLVEIRESDIASSASSVNAVLVTWHDPVTDEDRVVGVKNVAGVLRNGGAINSTTKDYTGVPIASLALRLAQRDLRAASTNLRRFTLVADRTLEIVHPGDVLVIQDAKRGIPKMAVRVGKVKDGTLLNGQITIEVIQDVFALPEFAFAAEVPSTYTKPDTRACIDEQIAFEAPYFMLANRMRAADLDYVQNDGGFMMAVASKGKAVNQGVQFAVRNSQATLDDEPIDGSYVCPI